MDVGDLLWFADVALGGMVGIVGSLGDSGANSRPYDGANSPYSLLTHCLGVMEFWGGEAIAGRTIVRDRPAEFRAAGPVGPLRTRASEAREQLAADLTCFVADDPPRSAFEDDSLPQPLTQRGCLLHLYEELAQHHGQMEILRDLIAAGGWSHGRPCGGA